MPDLFEEQLLECQFRGEGFPCTTFRVHLSQDTVQHKRPDQDGARVESTGRNPLTFDAQIPFYNSIARGVNETWSVPYPDMHRAFLASMADRSAGTLQHPSLGLIRVKPVSCETTLEAGRRDGEMVSAQWVEHSDDEDASNAILTSASPITQAVLSAIDLDSSIALTNLGGFDPDDESLSFEDAMRQVSGVFDKASLISRKTFGVIDRIIYRLDAVHFAIVSQKDPQNWPAKEAISRLRTALAGVKRAALKSQKDVSIYVTPGATTLGNLGAKLKNSVGDIIRLNPDLVNSPQVPAKTVIRYYQSIN